MSCCTRWLPTAALIAILALHHESGAATIPIDSTNANITGGGINSSGFPSSGDFSNVEFVPVSVSTAGTVDTNALTATGLNVSANITSTNLDLMVARSDSVDVTFDPPGFDPPFTTVLMFDFTFSLTADLAFSLATSLPSNLPIDPVSLHSPRFLLGNVAYENAVYSGFRDGGLVAQTLLGSGSTDVYARVVCVDTPSASCSIRAVGDLRVDAFETFTLGEMLAGATLPEGDITGSTFTHADGFVAVVPEPGTAALTAAGLLVLGVRRHRARPSQSAPQIATTRLGMLATGSPDQSPL